MVISIFYIGVLQLCDNQPLFVSVQWVGQFVKNVIQITSLGFWKLLLFNHLIIWYFARVSALFLTQRFPTTNKAGVTYQTSVAPLESWKLSAKSCSLSSSTQVIIVPIH